jgi:uncharacterized protein YbjT (DUF2867 family)
VTACSCCRRRAPASPSRNNKVIDAATQTGEARVGFIDTRDIAPVAAIQMTSPGTSYTLTGPDALSAAEVAERLSAAIGRQVRYVDVGHDAFRQGLRDTGLPGRLIGGWSRVTRSWRPATRRRSPTRLRG